MQALTISELNTVHRCVNAAYKAASRSARNPSIGENIAEGFRAEAHQLRAILVVLESNIMEASK